MTEAHLSKNTSAMKSSQNRRFFFTTLSAGALLTSTWPAVMAAEEWPNKPIKLMLGFPPGGGADAMARLIAIKMEKELGQPMLVENKSGATGTICSAFVAQSAPDGYTLQLAHVSSNAIGPLLLARGKFDAIKDFTPIGLVGITPHVLAVNNKHGFKSVADLIAQAKAAPGKFTFMSAGIGSAPHLAGEGFKTQAGIDMLHVPFKGTGEAMTSLLAGDVDMTFSSTGSVLPHVKSGKLKALAVCSPKRLLRQPDVPTISETLPGYEAFTWYGLAGPAKLPAAVVSRIESALKAILSQVDVIKRLNELDAETRLGTAAQFSSFWNAEVAKYDRIITSTKLTVN